MRYHCKLLVCDKTISKLVIRYKFDFLLGVLYVVHVEVHQSCFVNWRKEACMWENKGHSFQRILALLFIHIRPYEIMCKVKHTHQSYIWRVTFLPQISGMYFFQTGQSKNFVIISVNSANRLLRPRWWVTMHSTKDWEGGSSNSGNVVLKTDILQTLIYFQMSNISNHVLHLKFII